MSEGEAKEWFRRFGRVSPVNECGETYNTDMEEIFQAFKARMKSKDWE